MPIPARTKIIKLQDHFHGWHDYAMAGSDRSAPGIPDASMDTMVIVPPGDLGAVEDALNRDDDIAALILEPTGAHMGQMTFDTPVYLKGLRELTAQHEGGADFRRSCNRLPRLARGGAGALRNFARPYDHGQNRGRAGCPVERWAARPRLLT